jgi:hypothetical protein
MHRLVIAIHFVALSCFSGAVIAEPQTTDFYLRNVESFLQKRCTGVAAKQKADEARDKRMAETLKRTDRTLCECVPVRLKQLRASLSRAELDAKATEKELNEIYAPRLLNPCAAEQTRLAYSEESGCAARFAGMKTNSAKYCACMFKYASEVEDAEAAMFGGKSSHYIPFAAGEEKRRFTEPPRSESLNRFFAKEAACSAGG